MPPQQKEDWDVKSIEKRRKANKRKKDAHSGHTNYFFKKNDKPGLK